VAFQLIEEVTAHAQSDSLEDAREICADGTYFPNNLRRCYLFYYTYDTLNMFRALLCPSSGAHEYSADYHMGRPVLGLLLVGS